LNCSMRYIIGLSLIIIFLCACSSSSGVLSEKDLEREYREKITAKGLTPFSDKKSGLTIETDPRDALIYLNNQYYDTSPFTITNLKYGMYFLTIKKPGFYSYSIWITYSETERYYRFTLEPILGSLSLQVTPDKAIIELGKSIIPAGTTNLPVGSYILRVRSFGFQDYTTEVTIQENKITSLVINLEKAPVSISNLAVNRKIFNPQLLSVFGATNISFQVSSFGKGQAVIYNEQGEKVYTHQFPSFDNWIQSFTWQGKDEKGNTLPDGVYSIEITAFGDGEKQSSSGKIDITLDSSLDLSYRNLWSGTSGLLYVPTIEVLPLGNFQFQSLFMANPVSVEGQSTITVPSALSMRIGLPINSELDAVFKLIIENMIAEPLLAASVSYKMQLLKTSSDPAFSTGIILKFTYQYNYTRDPYADYSGATIGIPLQLKVGPFSLLLATEIIFSWQQVSSSSSAGNDNNFYSWLYGRAGIFYDSGYVLCGLSLSLRSTPFSQRFAVDLPFRAAVEINALIPETPLYVSAIIGLEFEEINDYYILGGFGFGFLW
jgi:hypothetical protein